MTSCAFLYPLTFCTTRISVDVGDNDIVKREFHNVNDCARKVYRSDGYRGFYQGVIFSSLGVFLYRFQPLQLEIVIVVMLSFVAGEKLQRVGENYKYTGRSKIRNTLIRILIIFQGLSFDL